MDEKFNKRKIKIIIEVISRYENLPTMTERYKGDVIRGSNNVGKKLNISLDL